MDTFFCGNCGEEVAASAKVCPNCGAHFEKDASTNVIVNETATFDFKVKKNVIGLEKMATTLKIIFIVCSLIIFFGGIIISSEYEEGAGAIFFIYTIYALAALLSAFISELVFNWLSHMLNCTYQITKKKK